MAKRRARTGSPKGQPKPVKSPLDAEFPRRLWAAMTYRELTNHAELARLARCSRAAIGQYLKGPKSTPSPVILLRIAKVLRISPYWLVLNEGHMLDGVMEQPPPKLQGDASVIKKRARSQPEGIT